MIKQPSCVRYGIATLLHLAASLRQRIDRYNHLSVNCHSSIKILIEMEPYNNEELTTKQKGQVRMRTIMDFGMGILWLGMGVFMIFPYTFVPDIALQYDDDRLKIFGAVCLLYGSFRIYRAVKKNYFRES